MKIKIIPDSIDFEPEDRSVGIFGSCFITVAYIDGKKQDIIVFNDGEVRDSETDKEITNDYIAFVQCMILYRAQKNKIGILQAARETIYNQVGDMERDDGNYAAKIYGSWIDYVFLALDAQFES